jgi:hypothetical protein
VKGDKVVGLAIFQALRGFEWVVSGHHNGSDACGYWVFGRAGVRKNWHALA